MKTETSVGYKSQNQTAPRKSRILVVDDNPRLACTGWRS